MAIVCRRISIYIQNFNQNSVTIHIAGYAQFEPVLFSAIHEKPSEPGSTTQQDRQPTFSKRPKAN
jgi:hypothetical protein